MKKLPKLLATAGTVAVAFAILSFFSRRLAPTLAINPDDWPAFGYDATNSKFSPLKNIDESNVSQLKEVWRYDDPKEGGGTVFWNPVVVKGRMFVFTPGQKLAALEPATGKPIWEFQPDSTDIATWTRGLTYHAGKAGTPDALLFVYGSTLYSIDAANGQLVKSFGKNGRVDFYEGMSVEKSMRAKVHVTANAPGVIFNNLLIIGCKVPDELPATSGDIRAFDVNTGKLVWTFHTIPKKGEFGSDTWPENARDRSGGANCWGGMALDYPRGIVYVPTASPSFDFYGADRPGKNLFANCLLALDAKTGKRLWHFQTTHHDLWDRDNGSPPNLLTVNHGGKRIDAVALATKMGYVFLFNRETGEPLFPIEEVPVPTTSEMPGEKPWPTQPIPTKPAPFSRQGFRPEYYSDLDAATTQHIKDDIKTNGYQTGIYEPPNLRGSLVVPSANGGANWGGGALNPGTNVLYINAVDLPWIIKLTEIKKLSANNDLSGQTLFTNYCSGCHGLDRKGTDYGPNIVAKVERYSAKRLDAFIKRGAEPMPSFKHLPQTQLDAIVSYLKGEEFVAASSQKTSNTESASQEPYGFSGYGFYLDQNGFPAIKPPYGTMNAIDLDKGEILWQVPLGEDPELAKRGIKNTGSYSRGGGIATAGGLLFIGATGDNKFRAFAQKDGKVLWETQLPGRGSGIPATYAVDGRQYVTIAVNPSPGNGYRGGYVTFAL